MLKTRLRKTLLENHPNKMLLDAWKDQYKAYELAEKKMAQQSDNYCFCYKYYKELFKNGIHLWIRFNLYKLILIDGLNLKISDQSKCLFYKKIQHCIKTI